MTDSQIKKMITRFKRMRDNTQAMLDDCGRCFSTKSKQEINKARRFAEKGIQTGFATLEKRSKK
tara:strand:- start:791 stop:982 length:192 start_codon:yes stop_codon:yes gene_type:complete